mgnify:FL=1
MVSQAKGSPKLIEYLTEVLEEEVNRSIFTEGYGTERAYHDGKAHTAMELIKLLRGITNE